MIPVIVVGRSSRKRTVRSRAGRGAAGFTRIGTDKEVPVSGWKNLNRSKKVRRLSEPTIIPGGPDHLPTLGVRIEEPGQGHRYGRLDLDRHTLEFLHRETGRLLDGV